MERLKPILITLTCIVLLASGCYWMYGREVATKKARVVIMKMEYIAGNSEYRQRIGNTQTVVSARPPRYKTMFRTKGGKEIEAEVPESEIGARKEGDKVVIHYLERGIPKLMPEYTVTKVLEDRR